MRDREAYPADQFASQILAKVELGEPIALSLSGPDQRVRLGSLAQAAAQSGTRVFLAGSCAKALTRAAQELCSLTAGTLNIAGSWAGTPGNDNDTSLIGKLASRLEASGADLCFVALPTPYCAALIEVMRARGLSCAIVCLDSFPGSTRLPAFAVQ